MDPEELDDIRPAVLSLASALEPKLRKVIQDSMEEDLSDEAQVMAAVMAAESIHARTIALAVHMGLLDSDVRESYWKDNRYWPDRFDEALAQFDKRGLFSPPGERG